MLNTLQLKTNFMLKLRRSRRKLPKSDFASIRLNFEDAWEYGDIMRARMCREEITDIALLQNETCPFLGDLICIIDSLVLDDYFDFVDPDYNEVLTLLTDLKLFDEQAITNNNHLTYVIGLIQTTDWGENATDTEAWKYLKMHRHQIRVSLDELMLELEEAKARL